MFHFGSKPLSKSAIPCWAFCVNPHCKHYLHVQFHAYHVSAHKACTMLCLKWSLLAWLLQTEKCDTQDPRFKRMHYLLYCTQPIQWSEVCGGSSAQRDPCPEVVPTPAHIYDGQGGLCRYTTTLWRSIHLPCQAVTSPCSSDLVCDCCQKVIWCISCLYLHPKG